MFSVNADAVAQRPASGLLEVPPPDPTRIVKPWAILYRLRPVKLAAIGGQLLNYSRTIDGLRLIESHFPQALDVPMYRDLYDVGWWKVLAHLVNLVGQGDWFEVDWTILNKGWEVWTRGGEKSDGGEQLAALFHYIPVKLYGFTDTNIALFPPMELLRALLKQPPHLVPVSSKLLIETELYDTLKYWSEGDRDALWQNMYRIEGNPLNYPVQLRWLPELARWVCGTTGNVILDRTYADYERYGWFHWDTDLETIKSHWLRAKPVIDQFHKLVEWCKEQKNLITFAHFLMEGGDYDQLNW